MSYLVLARKWRPQGFEAITGQDHVTRTLTNAIAQDRVHHAFLFCGARGVGKTSAARVFARALNCRRDAGPTADPCGVCEACVEIAAGNALDVFEIDGASNRGISEIRELRDGVAYAPQRDRFKIYIIDEVHMLTTEAFNALLKTLEEPPRHVKFIFATTEPHKIPVTILSRCQRFDFKRIPRGIMVERLQGILEAEGVAIDEAALRVVARESEGSMRDALSLLDRIISFCGQSATYAQVAEVLGVADRGWLTRLVRAALARDVAAALAVVEAAFEFGIDLRQFATDLVHVLRDMIVLKVAGDKAGLTDLSAEETRGLVELGAPFAVDDLQRLASIAVRAAERLAHANFPRLELEMAVVRMASLRPLQPIGELVQRLEAIERHLASGAPLPPPRPLPALDAHFDAPPPPTTYTPVDLPQRTPPPAPRAVVTSPPAATVVSVALAPRDLVATDVGAFTTEGTEDTEGSAGGEGLAGAGAQRAEAPQAADAAGDAGSQAAGPEGGPQGEGTPPGAEAATEATAGFTHEAWEGFVDAVRADDAALAGALDHAQVVALRDGVVEIAFAGRSSAGRAQASGEALAGRFAAHHGGSLALAIREVRDGQLEESPFRRREVREEQARELRRRDLEQHPLVRDVVHRFGGQVERVDLDEPARPPAPGAS